MTNDNLRKKYELEDKLLTEVKKYCNSNNYACIYNKHQQFRELNRPLEIEKELMRNKHL